MVIKNHNKEEEIPEGSSQMDKTNKTQEEDTYGNTGKKTQDSGATMKF